MKKCHVHNIYACLANLPQKCQRSCSTWRQFGSCWIWTSPLTWTYRSICQTWWTATPSTMHLHHCRRPRDDGAASSWRPPASSFRYSASSSCRFPRRRFDCSTPSLPEWQRRGRSRRLSSSSSTTPPRQPPYCSRSFEDRSFLL